MSLRIRRWSTTVNPRISLLDYGSNRSISAGATPGKRNVRKAFIDSRGKARGKSLGLVSLYIRTRLKNFVESRRDLVTLGRSLPTTHKASSRPHVGYGLVKTRDAKVPSGQDGAGRTGIWNPNPTLS